MENIKIKEESITSEDPANNFEIFDCEPLIHSNDTYIKEELIEYNDSDVKVNQKSEDNEVEVNTSIIKTEMVDHDIIHADDSNAKVNRNYEYYETQVNTSIIKTEIEDYVIESDENGNNKEEQNCIESNKSIKIELVPIDIPQQKNNPDFFDVKTEKISDFDSNIKTKKIFNRGEKHSSNPKKYQCDICKEKLKYKHSLKRHLLCHENKVQTCKICYKTFNDNFKRHMNTHIATTIYKCEQCSKEFKQKFDLRQHLNIHTGNTFNCDQCDKTFYRKYSLKRHKLEHLGVKYKCEVCFKEYNRKSTLIHHKCIFSNKNVDLKYECEVCLQEYSSKYTFLHHNCVGIPEEIPKLATLSYLPEKNISIKNE